MHPAVLSGTRAFAAPARMKHLVKMAEYMFISRDVFFSIDKFKGVEMNKEMLQIMARRVNARLLRSFTLRFAVQDQ